MSDYLAVLPLEDVKEFLNLTETEDKLDAWLGREAKSQLQVIEEYLDRPVIVQQFREEIDSTGGTILRSRIHRCSPLLICLLITIDGSGNPVG